MSNTSSEIKIDLSAFREDSPKKSILTPQDILDEVAAVKKYFEALPHREVLKALLEKVEPVDFRSLAKLENEGEQLKKKHYLILTIEQVIKLALSNHWGLCKKHDFVYLYNGAYWSLLGDDELKDFLGKMAERMGIDRFDARLFSFRDLLFKQFHTAAHLPEPNYNHKVVLINLLNGTFQVSPTGGELKPFDRNDFITHQLPFEYNPTATAPLFEAYLNKVQPDEERQKVLAEFLAYIFARHLKLEKTLLLFGTGANGKSVFFEIVNALLGKENVTNYSLNSLTNESGYYRAKLGNALVNYASEINGRLETSIFKQLVSSEPVEARLPYGEPFTLTHYARLIFNCNELPREVEHTKAYFRRFLIVPFEVTIPEEEQDRELATKIIGKELSGVFNWVLDGLNRLLQQKKFTESAAVQRQLENYRLQSDSVHLFIEEERMAPSAIRYRLLKEIYWDYKTFCSNDNYRSVSKKNFRKRLEAKGFQFERKNIGIVVFLEKV